MTRRFLVRGRVQGVGFRWFTLRAARGLGVTGFVRNLPDGAVEVVASGADAALKALGARLAHGPPGADVHRVDHEELAADQPFSSFEVR